MPENSLQALKRRSMDNQENRNPLEREERLLLNVVSHIRKTWKDQLVVYPTMKSKDLDMLAFIYNASEPITMQDLAFFLKVSPAAVTQMTAAMEKKHILKKETNEKDHRINHIVLHPELMEAIEKDHTQIKEKLRRFDEYTNHEFDLEKILSALSDFFEQDLNE